MRASTAYNCQTSFAGHIIGERRLHQALNCRFFICKLQFPKFGNTRGRPLLGLKMKAFAAKNQSVRSSGILGQWYEPHCSSDCCIIVALRLTNLRNLDPVSSVHSRNHTRFLMRTIVLTTATLANLRRIYLLFE